MRNVFDDGRCREEGGKRIEAPCLLSRRPNRKKQKCHLTAEALSLAEALSVVFNPSLRPLSLAHRGTLSFLLILNLLKIELVFL
jgi:hypothetical protein